MKKSDILSEKNLNDFADAIELYIDELEHVMIIPKDVLEKEGDKIRKNIELAKKLVSKIRKGKMSVFKDPDEWDDPTFDE